MTVTITDARAARDAEWDSRSQSCVNATHSQSRQWVALSCALETIASRPEPRAIVFHDGGMAVVPVPVPAVKARKGLVKTHRHSAGGGYGGRLLLEAISIGHAACLSLMAGGMTSARNTGAEAVAPQDGIEAVVGKWTKGHRSAMQKADRAV